MHLSSIEFSCVVHLLLFMHLDGSRVGRMGSRIAYDRVNCRSGQILVNKEMETDREWGSCSSTAAAGRTLRPRNDPPRRRSAPCWPCPHPLASAAGRRAPRALLLAWESLLMSVGHSECPSARRCDGVVHRAERGVGAGSRQGQEAVEARVRRAHQPDCGV